eukprot:13049239-Alexandrium_andersonii.AAC.1
MPRAGNMLPRDQGMDWRMYLEYGHDEYSKNFDPLWQSGPLDIRGRPEDPPEELGDFPSFTWGSQYPRYEAIRKE